MTAIPSSAAALDSVSHLRRAFAFFVDFVVGLSLASVVNFLVGCFVALDTAAAMMPLFFTALAVMALYLGFATPLVGNSVGKWIFGLRIVGHDGRAPRWLPRFVGTMIWPVSAFQILFSESGRHWGDRLGRTQVMLVQPPRSLWRGLALAVCVLVLASRIDSLERKLATLSRTACNTARAHLARTHSRVARLPKAVQIVNDRALFDFEVDGAYERVELQRAGFGWRVTATGPVGEPLTGAGVRFETR